MLLDSYVLPNYYKHGVTRDFDYKEFVNHIEITKYVGSKRSVTVPGEINGKPITIVVPMHLPTIKVLKQLHCRIR